MTHLKGPSVKVSGIAEQLTERVIQEAVAALVEIANDSAVLGMEREKLLGLPLAFEPFNLDISRI